MNIVFLGPQSSGKGTQAEMLGKKLNIPTLTAGGILRKTRRSGGADGGYVASFMDAGKLVPDEFVDKIVEGELTGEEYKSGVILDGYPRNEHQREELEKYFNVDMVIFLDVPDALLVKRMELRRICGKCGANYNLQSKPPKAAGVCDECGGGIVQRTDDTKEASVVRLNVYHKETEPLIEYYEKQGKLVRIDGTKNIGEVHEKIMKHVESGT